MDMKEFLEAIKKMNALELNDLAKAIQEEFDISAMPSMAAAPAAGGAAAEASTDFDVKITDIPADKKIAAIKVIKDISPAFGGLAGAKKYVEDEKRASILETIKDDRGGKAFSKEEADELVKKITDAGAKAEAVSV